MPTVLAQGDRAGLWRKLHSSRSVNPRLTLAVPADRATALPAAVSGSPLVLLQIAVSHGPKPKLPLCPQEPIP